MNTANRIYVASETEILWGKLLLSACKGDERAYIFFLASVTPALHAIARRCCLKFCIPLNEQEDIVQDVLLTLHLKHSSWDETRPVGPWLKTIVRNKMIDHARRRARYAEISINDLPESSLPYKQPDFTTVSDVEKLLTQLSERQSDIVRSISIRGESVSDTAARLKLSDGAIRVYLHRALKLMAAHHGHTEIIKKSPVL